MVGTLLVMAIALGQAADPLSPTSLRKTVEVLSADQLRGRDTPSPGLDAAGRFIADSLASTLARPAGEVGSYFQGVPIRQLTIDPKGTTVTFGGQTFRHGEDFIAIIPPKPGKIAVTGGLVFVSHGWIVKAKGIDPYKGLDLKGKVVVVCPTSPKGLVAEDMTGPVGSTWSDPISAIKSRGAAGVILSPAFHNLVGWQQTRLSDVKRGRAVFPNDDLSQDLGLPAIIASPRLLSALFDGESISAAEVFNGVATREPPASRALSDSKIFTAQFVIKERRTSARNVIAMIPGTDPVLKHEVVAVGAHLDHIGLSREVAGDSIYNGADDNASGCAALLAVAKALSKGPRPRRSVLFIWHCGEEKGNMGSLYFVDHPTVDLKKVVAYVNVDMVGRSKRPGDKDPLSQDLSAADTLYALGPKVFSRDLDALVAQAASRSGMKLDSKFDSLNDPNQLMFRSDQTSYGAKGIPFVFFYGGEHRDYHQPSDSAEKLDYEKLALASRLIMETVRAVANEPQRPRMDRGFNDRVTPANSGPVQPTFTRR